MISYLLITILRQNSVLRLTNGIIQAIHSWVKFLKLPFDIHYKQTYLLLTDSLLN